MSAPSAGSTPSGGVTRVIIQRVIYGVVALVALFLVLVTALVHHFTYDACANIAGRQKKVPAGYHLEGDDENQCVANPPPRTTATAPVVEKHPTSTYHPFEADDCYETDLGYEARWSPKDKAMWVFAPDGSSHEEFLGMKAPIISTFGPGHWCFCRKDPDATGVVIYE